MQTLLRLKKHAYQVAPKPGSGDRWLSVGPDITLDEWEIDSVEVFETSKIYRFEDRTYSQVISCLLHVSSPPPRVRVLMPPLDSS